MASSLPPQLAISPDPRLPKLEQETELHKMLIDEKMRSEKHRTNYQTLKVEHTRLQDEYMIVQRELKSTIEESKLVQEKYTSLMDQLRKELADKLQECERLKAETLTSQKLDMVRLEVREEVEAPYREKYKQMEADVDKYRTEYNKLKYSFSFLKSEFEHEKTENQRILEEMKLRHEAEVCNLRKEREEMISRQQTEGATDSQRVRHLQRENAQMHLKMKGLLTELEEIRAQREHEGLQSDNVSRLQNKQLAEHAANVKALETEKESLKLQCSSLQKEVANNNELQTQLTNRIHDLEKENIQLKNRAEETTHKSKVELTNLKMEMLKERGELERQRDRLTNQIEDVHSEVDVLKQTISQQEEALVQREREAVTRVQAAREEEWHKLHHVENEKLELETRLQEQERRKIDEETHRHTDREKIEERIKHVTDAKQEMEKDLLVARTKIQHQQALLETIDRERSENADLKTRLHRIESTYNSYMGSERELVDTNALLKRQVEEMRIDVDKLRSQLRNAQDEGDKVLVQHRTTWAEEKLNFQRRIDDLDTQTVDLHNKMSTIVTDNNKKKKKYCNLITKLKHKLTLTMAKNEELSIERDALKKSVPASAHLLMKKQLKDLVRRHHDYRTLLLSGNVDEINIGNLSFASATVPLDMSNLGYLDLERQHQKDLDMLKDRLDVLDDHQRQQLNELKPFTPASHTIPPDLQDISPIQSRHSSPLGSDGEQDTPRSTEQLPYSMPRGMRCIWKVAALS